MSNVRAAFSQTLRAVFRLLRTTQIALFMACFSHAVWVGAVDWGRQYYLNIQWYVELCGQVTQILLQVSKTGVVFYLFCLFQSLEDCQHPLIEPASRGAALTLSANPWGHIITGPPFEQEPPRTFTDGCQPLVRDIL